MSSCNLRFTRPNVLAKLMDFDELMDEGWSADDYTTMFKHLMSVPIRQELAGAGTRWERVLEHVPLPDTELRKTFDEAIHEEYPRLELLELVKRYAKFKWRDPQQLLPRAIAMALYFAAIAAALHCCGRRITKLDDKTMRRGFDAVSLEPWLDEKTRALFAHAAAHLSPADEAFEPELSAPR